MLALTAIGSGFCIAAWGHQLSLYCPEPTKACLIGSCRARSNPGRPCMEPMDGTNLCNHCGHGTHGLEPKQPIQPNATNPHGPLSVLMCSERAACIASRIHVCIIIVHVFSSRVLHTDCCQSIFHINFDCDIFLDISIMTSPEVTIHADLHAVVIVSGSPMEIKSFFDQIAPPALRAAGCRGVVRVCAQQGEHLG